MKKFFVIGVVCVLFLSGCGGNKVTCKGEVEEDGIKMKMVVNASFADEKVKTASAVIEFETEEEAKQYCSLLELGKSFMDEDEKAKLNFECKGKKISMNDYLAFSDEDAEDYTKADFEEDMKDSELVCK